MTLGGPMHMSRLKLHKGALFNHVDMAFRSLVEGGGTRASKMSAWRMYITPFISHIIDVVGRRDHDCLPGLCCRAGTFLHNFFWGMHMHFRENGLAKNVPKPRL